MGKAIIIAWITWVWFGIYLLYCIWEEFNLLFEDAYFWFFIVGIVSSVLAAIYFFGPGKYALYWPLTKIETFAISVCSFIRIGFVYRMITSTARAQKRAIAKRMQRKEEEKRAADEEGRGVHLGYIDASEYYTTPGYGQLRALFGNKAQIYTWLILIILATTLIYYKDYTRMAAFSILYFMIDFVWRFVMNGAQWNWTLYSYEGSHTGLDLEIPTYNFVICIVWQVISILFLWITIHTEPADLILRTIKQLILSFV